MNDPEAKIGEGRFRWNAGAWFGSVLGSTLFLLLGACAFLFRSPVLAVVWFASFLGPVVFAIVLWKRRSVLAPYPAVQMLMAAVGLGWTVAALSEYLWEPGLFFEKAVHLTILLMFPGLMLFFHLVNRYPRSTG